MRFVISLLIKGERDNVASISIIQGRERQRVGFDQKYFNSPLSQGKIRTPLFFLYFEHGDTALVSIKMLSSIG